MNLDEDKIYTKTIAFDKIYNFVVKTFFHLKWSKDNFKWKKVLTTKL
jgi:hypothetical protein